MYKLAFVLLALSAVFSSTSATDKIICYYESWAAYGDMAPENFDPTLCTHANYAFIGLKDDGNLVAEDPELDINQGLYYRVTDWKKKNPNLKVLLSVGGASAGAASLFAGMAADPGKRQTFIGSANYFIQTYNFDGLDLDWELPYAGDKDNYITLLRELRNNFNQNGWLLTAAVSAEPGEGYNVPEMANLLDFINVMTYDMYGSWSTYTGQNSPLYASSVESDWEKENLNLAAAGWQWVNAGAPAEKLAMGVAFYGRSFTLADPNQHGIHAPITGVGVGEGGSVNYNQACSTYGDWERIWDDEQKNPYKVNGNQWFGYDDQDSIWIKVDYIKSQNFGGVMIWPIDGDDVHGVCGPKQNLLATIRSRV